MVVGNSKETPKSKDVESTKTVKASNVANTSSMENKEKTSEEEKTLNPKEDGAFIGKNSRSQTPPFHLTFEIFNRTFIIVLLIQGLHQM